MDVIGIDQVYDAYYRPDLVAAKIRGEDISAYASSVQLASLVRSGSAPIVSLADVPVKSSARDMQSAISVRNTGGGIGAVNLLLNGKVIRLSDGVASKDGETVVFHHTVTLQNGSNTLEAFALNGAGLVESVRANAEVVWQGATEKPDLYVLTAAVNKYRDKSLWLNYAVPDAETIAGGFQKQKSGLYRNVHIAQLNDGEVTKEKLSASFSNLAQNIRADDVFVFFVSGHGVFIYVLLEGIAGAADSDGDGYVTLNELSAFVEKEVPERSYEKWGYEQVPQKDLRRQDFPIAGKWTI